MILFTWFSFLFLLENTFLKVIIINTCIPAKQFSNVIWFAWKPAFEVSIFPENQTWGVTRPSLFCPLLDNIYVSACYCLNMHWQSFENVIVKTGSQLFISECFFGRFHFYTSFFFTSLCKCLDAHTYITDTAVTETQSQGQIRSFLVNLG